MRFSNIYVIGDLKKVENRTEIVFEEITIKEMFIKDDL